jgi:hypothetical protein
VLLSRSWSNQARGAPASGTHASLPLHLAPLKAPPTEPRGTGGFAQSGKPADGVAGELLAWPDWRPHTLAQAHTPLQRGALYSASVPPFPHPEALLARRQAVSRPSSHSPRRPARMPRRPHGQNKQGQRLPKGARFNQPHIYLSATKGAMIIPARAASINPRLK